MIHCPGHTAGSICLYKPGEAIFVGDALRTDAHGNPKASTRAMSLDPEQAQRSLGRLAELEFDVLLPGHGEPIRRNASERVKNWLKSGR